jgi:3-oxoacyl-[acyl-carrier protein] reductase
MSSLAGHVAIVTGASRGIGKAIAAKLGAAGCRLTLTARSAGDLEAVKREIEHQETEVITVAADLTLDGDIERIVDASLQRWGTIDGLVNNAGWGKKEPVVKTSMEDWDRTFKVNVRAPMLLAKLVLPTLLSKRSGAIVNIGSVSAKMGQANVAAYSASKFALAGLTESLFEEVREHGIKVAAIHPGYVDTRLIPQSARLDRSKMIRPEDVADAVLFVLSSSPRSCPIEIILRPQRSPYL